MTESPRAGNVIARLWVRFSMLRIWRSLLVKWWFTLLFTGLFGVGLVWFIANRASTVGFDQLKLEQAQAEFQEIAVAYYKVHGSWDSFPLPDMPQMRRFITQDNPFGRPPLRFILADEQNRVLIDAAEFRTGETLTADQIARGTPIMVNNQRVGTVIFVEGSPSLSPNEERYLAQLNQGLVAGAISAAVIAFIVGFVLAQHFMRPLRDLTLALSAMQRGDLGQTVPVRSQDELGALSQSFNQMSEALAQANFLRRRMTADIAHDLRTPLTIIGGYLEGLQDGTLKPTAQRFETMHREVVRLKHLVEDLRTLSLADAGELKLSCQSLPVTALLNQVAAAFQPLLDEQQLHLEIQPTEGVLSALPLTVYGDEQRILQVLSNLISNATQHTLAGGTVSLYASQTENSTQLTIQDTGKGIPAAQLPYIFERSYRVDASRSADDGGSGLGLAIVKSIMEAHGGTVTANSELGKGTRITLQFPKHNLVNIQSAY